MGQPAKVGVVVGAVLVFWLYVIGPGLQADRLSAVDRSLLAAYLLGDLLILLTAVRLMVAAGRVPAVIRLAVGAAGLLTADVSYAVAQVGSGWQSGGPAEVGYLLLYLCWGAAALHPSMALLTAPVQTRSREPPRRWIILLGGSLVIPSGVLVVESTSGLPDA